MVEYISFMLFEMLLIVVKQKVVNVKTSLRRWGKKSIKTQPLSLDIFQLIIQYYIY